MGQAAVRRAERQESRRDGEGAQFQERRGQWMKNLRGKDIHNGALVALDYQTGELIAYVGSADYYATKSTAKFQAKFDVVGSGFRQPGSAFKPFNYLTAIDDKQLTAARCSWIPRRTSVATTRRPTPTTSSVDPSASGPRSSSP